MERNKKKSKKVLQNLKKTKQDKKIATTAILSPLERGGNNQETEVFLRRSEAVSMTCILVKSQVCTGTEEHG